MKQIFNCSWISRRGFFVLALLSVVGLYLLHPFVRQSLFGPTIDGIPWCVWENQIRRNLNPERKHSWLQKMLEDYGLIAESIDVGSLQNPNAYPLYLCLTGDHDARVRHFALSQIGCRMDEPEWWKNHEAEVVSAFRRHLDDSDPMCRLQSAYGICMATKEKEPIASTILPLKDHADAAVRKTVAKVLGGLSGKHPDVFTPLSFLAVDLDVGVRTFAIREMHHFGNRSNPILKKALSDPDIMVRCRALIVIGQLKSDAAELVPLVRPLQNDLDEDIRRFASEALQAIESVEHPK